MHKDPIEYKLKRAYITQAIKWCEENIGINTRKRRELLVELSYRSRKMKKYLVYGNYCFFRNKIVIYVPNCKNRYDLISTLIHEYTHYLQSRCKYKHYEEQYSYSRNPYERQARRNELKYTKKCMRSIRKSILV